MLLGGDKVAVTGTVFDTMSRVTVPIKRLRSLPKDGFSRNRFDRHLPICGMVHVTRLLEYIELT